MPSFEGMFPAVTTPISVSPPPFPTETPKGSSTPALKSPFTRRFGLQAAVELAMAEDTVDEDVTEVSKVVTELELSVDEELVSEAVEETLEDDSDDVELSLVVDEVTEDSVLELCEAVDVADEVALPVDETPEPGETSPQGGSCSTAFLP